jgi:hypothetical protein
MMVAEDLSPHFQDASDVQDDGHDRSNNYSTQ